MNEGLSKERLAMPFEGDIDDLPGLYWSSRRRDIPEYLPWDLVRDLGLIDMHEEYSIMRDLLGDIITGIRSPESKVAKLPSKAFKLPDNSKDVDFFYRRIFDKEKYPSEYIQQRPGNVLAKWGDKYKILGTLPPTVEGLMRAIDLLDKERKDE
jgi:hypothetical protein